MMLSSTISTIATLSLALLTSTLIPSTTALPAVTRKGKYLYNADGSRFYIKGIAYQEAGTLSSDSTASGGFPEPTDYIDPLSSPTNCTRDIPYLTQLGVNAVRVYSVNPTNNHDACMSALDAAGIYVILDVSLPLNGSIDRAAPAWTTNLLSAYITTIDKFNSYPNILAFTIGNEVANMVSTTNTLPYVRAASRDVKAYLLSRGSSALVSYASVDGEADFRDPMANYLTCGGVGDNGAQGGAVDLYGLNNYEWCGASSYTASGWQAIVAGFSNIQVATYMSEYGCITSPPRVWTEVPVLFSTPVTDVFSGGMAFSYFPTSDGYGMVTLSGSNGQTVTPSDDFTRLAAMYKNVTSTPNTPSQSSVTPINGTCPTGQNSTFLASNVLPPTPNEGVCDCLVANSFTCLVTPAAAASPSIVGALLDYACSLLATSNSSASCSAIGGNGTSGVYGALEPCSPEIKLGYVFSAYYLSQNRAPTACDFGGNASIAATAPNTAQDASDAAQACLNAGAPGGVFTPSATASMLASRTGSATGSAAATGAATSRAASGAEEVMSKGIMIGLLVVGLTSMLGVVALL